MKRISVLKTLTVVVLLAGGNATRAQVPNLLNYQGRVAVGGVNFSGAGSFKFALVDSTAANTFWSNDGTSTAGSQPTNAVSLTVAGGLYSVLLGDASLANMTAIPATVFANADVRLRVWFNDGTNGFQLLTPDQRLAPNGYLPDGSVTTAKLAPNLTLGGTTTGTFAGDGSGLTGISSGGGSSYNVKKVALLKWGVSTVDNTFSMPGGPYGICFDGVNLWVANSGSGHVTELNAATGAVIGTYSVGLEPSGVCFDGTSVWVANWFTNNVTKLNAGTGVAVGTYSVGTNPEGICFDGASIWVANAASHNVTKLNAANGAVIGTYNAGNGPWGICFDGASIWVTNVTDGTVSKLNAGSGATLGTYNVGNFPFGICFDGTSVWVANNGDSSVTKLNADTGAVLGTYGLGTGQMPQTLCFDGTNIWVVNKNSTMVKLNPRTGAVIGTFPVVGTSPEGLCFDGGNIWLTDQNGNTVTKY